MSKTTQNLLSLAENAIRCGNKNKAKKFYKMFLADKTYHPDKWAAYFTYGNMLIEEGQVSQGISHLEKALEEKKFIEGYLELGTARQGLKQYDKAIICFEKAITLDATSDRAMYGLAVCHSELKDVESALPFITSALQIKPTAQYFDFAAVSYFMLGDYKTALKYQEQAYAFDQSYQSLSNLCDMYKKLGKTTKAFQTMREMFQVSPNSVEAHQHAAFLLLYTGCYEEGWKEYEWRRKCVGFFRIYSKPFWDGLEDLSGKTLFLYGEQGFGDILQCIRFVPILKHRFERLTIILECTPPLAKLFSKLDSVDEIRVRPMDQKWNVDVLENFDFHCSILSLPNHLNNTVDDVPYSSRYLHTDADKVKKWKGVLRNTFNVGLVWHGQAIGGTEVDSRRNIPLRNFMKIFDIEGTTFYSLQKGEASRQIVAEGLEEKILDYTNEFHDFSDTAAFVENLDLVIGVDTAVIHLAGGLGKPTWLLNRMDGCWRWGDPNEPAFRGNGTIWYDSVRIFRQNSWLKWEDTLEEVYFKLQHTVKPSAKLQLPQVTLIIVDCVDYSRARTVLDRCMDLCDFADVKLLTHMIHRKDDPQVVLIPEIKTLEDYSEFMVSRLGEFFTTSHVLVVQHDGFITDAEAWTDEFLDYDYIGAPWCEEAFLPKHLHHALQNGWIVGNGGFSLRSQKLQAALHDMDWGSMSKHCEDTVICIRLRGLLEQNYGIAFPPAKLAARFSTEQYVLGVTRNVSFGQHNSQSEERQSLVYTQPDFSKNNFTAIHLRNPGGEFFDHVGLLTFFAKWIKPKHYLELGIRTGTSFIPISKLCEKATGIDVIAPTFPLLPNMEIRVETTDNYFANLNKNTVFDMVFIDADHRHKQSLTDFMNVKDLVMEDGFIFLHDTYPIDSSMMVPGGCEDCYRTALWIKQNLASQFEVVTLPFSPGVTIIKKMPITKQVVYI